MGKLQEILQSPGLVMAVTTPDKKEQVEGKVSTAQITYSGNKGH